MIRLYHPTGILQGAIKLPSSKSISNRLLIIKHLYFPTLNIHNLSQANDTQLLKNILDHQNTIDKVNVQDAGTAFRFLTAYFSISNGSKTIFGTSRLHERPIAELVDLLSSCGAKINFENKGKAPLIIEGSNLSFDGVIECTNVKSSQFISALLMIAPKIHGNFSIRINTQMNSFSFVELTLNLMKSLGFEFQFKNDLITVSKKINQIKKEYYVEPDWTSFYYWWSMAPLTTKCNLVFEGLNDQSIQSEKKICKTLISNNINLTENKASMSLTKKTEHASSSPIKKIDFKQHPDLWPTFAFLLASSKAEKVIITGLELLKYKESDRVKATSKELKKLNVVFEEKSKNQWQVDASHFSLKGNTYFEVHEDHRMAMSIAPLAILAPIIIADEDVVSKSYPTFWQDLQQVGFIIEHL